MKTTIKIIILAIVIILLITNCNDNKNLKKVAIAQYIDHPMLDECRKGFMDEMAKLGYKENINITYEYLNAQGDMSINSSIAEKFGKGNYDLIYSIATPTTQALKKSTHKSQIPIVFGAITDPISAGLVNSLENSGNNLTGTSDVWPYYDQLKLIKLIIPAAKNIGVVYNVGETNTEYAISQTLKSADSLGFKIIKSPITNTNEVSNGAKSLVGKVDAIYITADNTTMSAAPIIIKIGNENNIPVFAGDPGTFKSGCIAGIGVSYYNLGIANAKMADQILKGKKKPADIPIVISDNPKLMINLKVAESLKIDIPASIIDKADEKIE